MGYLIELLVVLEKEPYKHGKHYDESVLEQNPELFLFIESSPSRCEGSIESAHVYFANVRWYFVRFEQELE